MSWLTKLFPRQPQIPTAVAQPQPRVFPGLPGSLFRYKAIDEYIEGVLADNTLWFSTITKMNDPCEAFYNIKIGRSESLAKHVLGVVRKHGTRSYVLEEIRKAGGVNEAELSNAVLALEQCAQMDEDAGVKQLMQQTSVILDPDLLASFKISQRAIGEQTILLC